VKPFKCRVVENGVLCTGEFTSKSGRYSHERLHATRAGVAQAGAGAGGGGGGGGGVAADGHPV
jgi:hypothetical protein